MHVQPFHIDSHTNKLSRRLVRALLIQFRDKISLYLTYDLSTLDVDLKNEPWVSSEYIQQWLNN